MSSGRTLVLAVAALAVGTASVVAFLQQALPEKEPEPRVTLRPAADTEPPASRVASTALRGRSGEKTGDAAVAAVTTVPIGSAPRAADAIFPTVTAPSAMALASASSRPVPPSMPASVTPVTSAPAAPRTPAPTAFPPVQPLTLEEPAARPRPPATAAAKERTRVKQAQRTTRRAAGIRTARTTRAYRSVRLVRFPLREFLARF